MGGKAMLPPPVSWTQTRPLLMFLVHENNAHSALYTCIFSWSLCWDPCTQATAGQWVFQITHLLMFQSTSSRDIPSTFSWRGEKRNRFLKFQVSENIRLLTLLSSPRDDPGIRDHSRVGGGFGKVAGILGMPERKPPAKDLGYTPRANRLDRKRLWCCYLTFKRVDRKGLMTFFYKLLFSEG